MFYNRSQSHQNVTMKILSIFIIGTTIGGLGFLLLFIIIIMCYFKRSHHRQKQREDELQSIMINQPNSSIAFIHQNTTLQVSSRRLAILELQQTQPIPYEDSTATDLTNSKIIRF